MICFSKNTFWQVMELKKWFLLSVLILSLWSGDAFAEQVNPLSYFQGGEVLSAPVSQLSESEGSGGKTETTQKSDKFNIYTKTYETQSYNMGLPASNDPILSELLKKIENQYVDSASMGRISKVSYKVTFNQCGILSIFILGYGIIEPGGNTVPIMESFNYFGGHRFGNAELINANALNDERVRSLMAKKLEAVGVPWVTIKPETTVYFAHKPSGGFDIVFSFFTNNSYDVLYSISISDEELKSISYPLEDFVIAISNGLLGNALNQIEHTVPYYVIDGKGAFTDLADLIPFYLNDVLMIPLRRVMEDVLYFEVLWNDERRFVEVRKDTSKFGLSINSKDYYLADGTVVKMEHMPLLVRSSTFVPLDFFSDLMGCNVSIGDGVLIVEFDTDIHALN